MSLNNLPGGSYLSAGAFALLPYESMAAKHQARQSEMQYGAMLLQSMQQQAAVVKQAQAERQQLWNTIASQDVLAPDKQRLQTLVSDYKSRMEKVIRDEYKGDGRRFERERQDDLLSEFRQDLANSPVLSKALSNKTNYALYQTEKAKNKLAMPIGYTQDAKGEIVGYTPYETQIQEFLTGKTDTLSQPDMIEFPKDALEKFSKEYKPGAQFGVYNPQTKRYEAPLVSAEEIRQSILNKGYDPQKAYFLTKFMLSDQVGQLRWKTEMQAPWDMEKMRHNMMMDLKQLGVSWYNANTSRMNANTSRERLNIDKAESQGITGAFDMGTTKPNMGIYPNQDTAKLIFPAKPNENGGNGRAGISTILPDKVLDPIKDIFGISDKPKKTRVAGFDNVPAVGSANEIVSPNTGQRFKGNYAITQMGNEIIYDQTIDPVTKQPKGQHYVVARVAIDDATAFDQNIKQNFGLWDQATTHFQGRNQEIIDGWTNDVQEYEVYLPIPQSAITKYQLDKATAPKGSAPYIRQSIQNAPKTGLEILNQSLN